MTTPATGSSFMIGSPRALAAWGLLGFVALSQFFAFFFWILPHGGGLASQSAAAGFRDLFVLAMPVLATLLAAKVAPVMPGARVVAAVAAVEYAIALFFGTITLLIGLGAVFDGIHDTRGSLGALQYLAMGVAALLLIAIAGYAVVRVYLDLGGRLRASWPAGDRATPPT